jgi:hypothetical protein
MPENHTVTPTGGDDVVAHVCCHRCPAVLTVTGREFDVVLEALHEQLRNYGWGSDARGRRLCPLHVDPPAREDAA